MASRNVETLRAYYEISERGDMAAAGQCIGNGYQWIDHTTELVARSPDELRAVREEFEARSDWTLEITHAHETTDGTVIAQWTWTRTLTGEWRSVEPKGQRVTTSGCTIFRFDPDARIVHEEQYEDALSVMRQLGALPGT